MTKIELYDLVLEIQKELIYELNLYGSKQDIVLGIKAKEVLNLCGLNNFDILMIDLDFWGLYTIRVNIPSKYIDDREYIKLALQKEVNTYLNIISICLEEFKLEFANYHNRLAEEWKKKQEAKNESKD